MPSTKTIKWEKIKEKLVYNGYRKIIKKYFKLPDGKIRDFDIKKEGKVVCMFPLTSNNEVILFKQFRPGPEKILLELPGGAVEKDEKPENAATREFLEETGYAGKMQFVGTTLDCAYSSCIRYNFVVMDCKKNSKPKFNENEFGKIVKIPLDEFKKHLKTGEMTDIETAYLCLDHLNLL